MKPLNHKERDDKFMQFVIAGTITLAITIFCFYYTNDFLSDAVANKRIALYSRYQQYQRHQQQYSKQLQQINQALSGTFQEAAELPKLVSDLKTSFTRNADTSALMNKILELCKRNLLFMQDKTDANNNLIKIKGEYIECIKKLNAKEPSKK